MEGEKIGKQIMEELLSKGTKKNDELKQTVSEKGAQLKETIKENLKGATLETEKPIPEPTTPESAKDLSNETKDEISKLLNGDSGTITLTSEELKIITEYVAEEGAKRALKDLSFTEEFKKDIDALIDKKIDDLVKTGKTWGNNIESTGKSFLEKGKELGKGILEKGSQFAERAGSFFKKAGEYLKDRPRSIAYNMTGLAQDAAKKLSDLLQRAGTGFGKLHQNLSPKQPGETVEKTGENKVKSVAKDAGEKLAEKVTEKATDKAVETVGTALGGPVGGVAAKAAKKVGRDALSGMLKSNAPAGSAIKDAAKLMEKAVSEMTKDTNNGPEGH